MAAQGLCIVLHAPKVSRKALPDLVESYRKVSDAVFPLHVSWFHILCKIALCEGVRIAACKVEAPDVINDAHSTHNDRDGESCRHKDCHFFHIGTDHCRKLALRLRLSGTVHEAYCICCELFHAVFRI